jgi:hypothetical protein
VPDRIDGLEAFVGTRDVEAEFPSADLGILRRHAQRLAG